MWFTAIDRRRGGGSQVRVGDVEVFRPLFLGEKAPEIAEGDPE